jgi:hypothetical protein
MLESFDDVDNMAPPDGKNGIESTASNDGTVPIQMVVRYGLPSHIIPASLSSKIGTKS